MIWSRQALFPIALSFVAAVAACTDGGPAASAAVGTYKVTSHREQHQQGTPVMCSDPGPEVVGGPPYFAVIVDTFFDDPHVLRLQTCAAPATCEDTIYGFTSGPHGFEELGANTQGGGGPGCNRYASRYTLAITGDVAHIELRHWYDATDVSAECTLEKAEALRNSASCESVETWDGTRVK